MKFREALLSIYREIPCQVLPNALWKTLAFHKDAEALFVMSKNGDRLANRVTHLEMWKKRQLYVYWDKNRQRLNLSRQHLRRLKFALMHQDFASAIPNRYLPIREPYFRLIKNKTDNNPPVPPHLPAGFRFANVHVETEASFVSDLINQCYTDSHVTPEIVKRWTHHPVFEPNLWLWVMDEKSNTPVGLGIAELDTQVPEGSLEWIQVLPAYRRRGLGQAIVQALLCRLHRHVAFTTVAGRMDNRTHPEALYRRCGFRGDDIWWVLKTA
jgi:GNAT superfamily N-acetyltransferase